MEADRKAIARAIEELVVQIATAALDISEEGRPAFVRQIVEGVREEYRRRFVSDPAALSQSLELAAKIEDWVKSLVSMNVRDHQRFR